MPRIALTTAELESMRSRLCVAALDVFREKGLEAVSLRALADVVGISHTLPYRYFENKEALLASVRVMCFEHFEAYVREREPVDAPVLGRVLSVVDAYVGFVNEHPAEYQLIFATPQPPPVRYPELLAARKSLFEHSVELAQLCVDEGHIGGDAREIAHSIWGSLHGLLTLHVANQLVHGYGIDALVRPTVYRILGLPMTTVYKVSDQQPAPGRKPSKKILKQAGAKLTPKGR